MPTAAPKPLSDRAIENRFQVWLPAGMKNLAWSTREQIKSDHKRRIQKIREKLEAGEPITERDLRRRGETS